MFALRIHRHSLTFFFIANVFLISCICRPDDLSTNRGNHLLHAMLSFRYPNLFSDASDQALAEWLSVTGKYQSNFFIRISLYVLNRIIREMPLNILIVLSCSQPLPFAKNYVF